MPYTVSPHPDYPILLVTASGAIYPADTLDLLPRAAQLMQEHALQSILVETAALQASYAIGDIYFNTTHLIKNFYPQHIHLAIVMPTEPDLSRIVRFFENVAQNFGWDVRTFTDQPDALAWLTDREVEISKPFSLAI